VPTAPPATKDKAMPHLYDLDASAERLLHAAGQVERQKAIIAKAPSKASRQRAEARLVEIEKLFGTIARTHVLLTATYHQLNGADAEPEAPSAVDDPSHA
jgi:hypothetical protein